MYIHIYTQVYTYGYIYIYTNTYIYMYIYSDERFVKVSADEFIWDGYD